MKAVIPTCKHHDGFCLWPSKYTEHSVKNSPCKIDFVGEIAKACRELGLKFGIYLSPWDRNHAHYGGPEYIEYFRNQLRELLTEYGEVSEVWFDGANGGDGYYGGAREERRIDRTAYYDWVKENCYLVPQDWPQWVDENLEQRAIVDFPQLSVDEINDLVDQGLQEFYLRPKQMWTMLRNIRSWADVKTKWHGLVSFVDYFGRSQ